MAPRYREPTETVNVHESVRRGERVMHPAGLGVGGDKILVVAFNRVIARQLRGDIATRLTTFDCQRGPVIQTIHALEDGLVHDVARRDGLEAEGRR